METILESWKRKTGPVSYVIKNQFDGSTFKVHVEMLRMANIADWQISKDETCRRLRDAAYLIPPVPSDSDSSSDSDSESNLRWQNWQRGIGMKEKLLRMRKTFLY